MRLAERWMSTQPDLAATLFAMDVRLHFEGANVTPETLDARSSLEVAFAFVVALEAVGSYEAGSKKAPFKLTLRAVDTGSVQHVFGVVPRDATSAASLSAIWQQTRRRFPIYLKSGPSAPAPIRKAIDNLVCATQKMPGDVRVSVESTDVHISLTDSARSSGVDQMRSVETFRAWIQRAGGKSPRLQLQVRDEPVFVLKATEELARAAGAALYTEADVTADLVRLVAPEFPVISGTVRALAVVEQVDPVAAMDAWYAAAGRPWSGITDIEAELERGRH